MGYEVKYTVDNSAHEQAEAIRKKEEISKLKETEAKQKRIEKELLIENEKINKQLIAEKKKNKATSNMTDEKLKMWIGNMSIDAPNTANDNEKVQRTVAEIQIKLIEFKLWALQQINGL